MCVVKTINALKLVAERDSLVEELQFLLQNIFQLEETGIFANKKRKVDASFLKYNYGFVSIMLQMFVLFDCSVVCPFLLHIRTTMCCA